LQASVGIPSRPSGGASDRPLVLQGRCRPGKPRVAVPLLTAAYFILRDAAPYHDLGGDHFERRNKAEAICPLVRRLADLGCDVEVKSAAWPPTFERALLSRLSLVKPSPSPACLSPRGPFLPLW
jgi:hypothetical protein